MQPQEPEQGQPSDGPTMQGRVSPLRRWAERLACWGFCAAMVAAVLLNMALSPATGGPTEGAIGVLGATAGVFGLLWWSLASWRRKGAALAQRLSAQEQTAWWLRRLVVRGLLLGLLGFLAFPPAALSSSPGILPFLLGLTGVSLLLVVVAPLALLIHAFLFRIQMSLLEFMVTMVAGMAAGVILLSAGDDKGVGNGDYALCAIPLVLGLGVTWCGTLWGLSAARRLGEGRPWPRLGLMALGWLMIPGVFALPTAPIITIALVVGLGPPLALVLGSWAALGVFAIGVRIEQRALRREQEAQKKSEAAGGPAPPPTLGGGDKDERKEESGK